MKLREDIPATVNAALREMDVDLTEIRLSLAGDIDTHGRYGRQWIVASPRGVWVFDDSPTSEPAVSVAMDTAQAFRIVPVVGAGLLQAKLGGVWIDLIRFSNQQKYWFGRLQKRLEQLREGASVELEAEDEHDPQRCRTCGLKLAFSGETCPRCVNRGAILRRTMRLMRPYGRLAAVMTSLLLVGIAIDMTGPLLTRHLVDRVLRIEPTAPAVTPSGLSSDPFSVWEGMPGTWENFQTPGTPISSRFRVLIVVVLVLAGVQILRALIRLLNGRVATRVGTAITYDIRGRLVSHLQQLGVSYYDKQQVGSLVGRVAYDTEAVHGFMSQLTAGFLMQVLMVACSGLLMFSLAPSLAIWALAGAPLVATGSVLYYRFIRPHYQRFYDRSAKQAGMLSGMLSGIRVVKAFAQEDRELGRFQESSAALRDARRRLDVSAATFYPLVGLLFQIGGWAVWYVGGGRVLNQQVSLGTLIAFLGYLGMFYGPLSSLTNLTAWLTQFATQMHRIYEVLDTPVATPEAAKPKAVPAMKGAIEFRNVTFGYSRQVPVLKNVSFRIEPGTAVGIVGRSGSGKTTIASLISRFYDIDDGEVLLDGVDVREIPLVELRQQVGVVLQEPFLFRGTLWDNLTYGRPEADEELVITACKAANAHDFVLQQYHAYDTWVGERGAGLSGGERQRLSIARALVCDPRVLVLDEATSSVDSESEMAIQRALEELIRERTSIIIAHRLSTLRKCHNIMVVDAGRVVEQGAHADLMKLDGKYARLVKAQTPAGSNGSTAAPADEPETPAESDSVMVSHRPRWLTPDEARIHLGNYSAMHCTVVNEGIYSGAYAVRMMPVRYPEQFISIRYVDSDDRDREVGLVRDLADWPPEAQELVREVLRRRYFVHTIERIETIRPLQNVLGFTVQTDLGRKAFFLRNGQDSSQDYGPDGKMLQDVEENRYVIPNVRALPDRDRRLFDRYVYW